MKRTLIRSLVLIVMFSTDQSSPAQEMPTKSEIQSRMDSLSQKHILNTVKNYHKAHFPDYIDLTPTAARVARGVEINRGLSTQRQLFELWQYKCKDKIFIHLIEILELQEMVFIFKVVTNDKFPKVIPA